MPFPIVRAAAAATAAALTFGAAAGAPAADGHVQVRPAQAAPGDPVLWTVLVPNERDVPTTAVELAIPRGVLPFAYTPLPGWRRTLTEKADRSPRSVIWRGTLRPGEVLSTTLLATTPDAEGPIAWKAIQTYADGRKVRWIGGPASSQPASVTKITRAAPRENAGGESAGGGDRASTRPAGDGAGTSGADGGDAASRVALGLSALALVIATGALVVARRRR